MEFFYKYLVFVHHRKCLRNDIVYGPKAESGYRHCPAADAVWENLSQHRPGDRAHRAGERGDIYPLAKRL